MKSLKTTKTTRTYSEKDILSIMKRDGITRKSAIRKYHKQAGKTQGTVASTATRATIALPPVERPIAPLQERQIVTVPAQGPKPEPPKTDAGKARAEGIALFKVAGRPSREDFQKVYVRKATD